MKCEAIVFADLTNGSNLLQFIITAPSPVCSILNLNKACNGKMGIVRIIDIRLNLQGINSAAVAINQLYRSAGVVGNSPAFKKINVSRLVANYFASRLGMYFNCNLVSHGS